jgi:hypothetical protein
LVEEREAIKKIANFENKMALHDQRQETSFPRHQTEGIWSAFSLLLTTVTLPLVNAPSNQQGKSKKHKSEAEQRTDKHGAVSHNMKKSLNAHPNPNFNSTTGMSMHQSRRTVSLPRPKNRNYRPAMWRLLCVEQVRKSFIFIQRNAYM